jgi:ribosome-associated protein
MSKLTETIAEAIDDKKGKDIVSLDLTGFDGAITDAFVVCGADSPPQVAAIAANIEEWVFEKLGEKVLRVEGLQNSLWVVMDYGEVMVHIFQTPMRDFYRLEQLWADAPMTHYFQQNQ